MDRERLMDEVMMPLPALALVYVILVVFFGSLLVPLVILLAVPLTTVGVFGALSLTNTALSLPSLLGLLLLIGIVVSNAILLIASRRRPKTTTTISTRPLWPRARSACDPS